MTCEVEKIELPIELVNDSSIIIDRICVSLGLPRETLPESESIDYALSALPRELNKIPKKFRDKDIAKMCVAISVGLYDDAIVRIWNSVIKELRVKISYYGIEMIKQVADENYNDNFLDNIKDSVLLTLARQLNIITKEGYYYLDQCRDIRNNASMAHPTEIEISDTELINFINRCNTHGLQDDYETKGIDMKMFIGLIEERDNTTTNEQLDFLSEQLASTFDSQKDLIWKILYSNATDKEKSTEIRNNSIYVAQKMSRLTIISEKIEADMLEKHNKFRLKGEDGKVTLSRIFLEKIGKINNIDNSEKISLFNKAITQLHIAHIETNNFYNEPPFAERLNQLSEQLNPIPELVLNSLVSTVLKCYLGNAYGVCLSAQSYYMNILINLSPKGIEILLRLPSEDQYFKSELTIAWKNKKFKELLEQVDENSLNTKQQYRLLELLK